MVLDLIRDSAFGHIVRLASRGKYFQYAEEADPSLWKKYINEEKSNHQSQRGSEASSQIDPEKGRDRKIIDWFGPEDPDVSTTCQGSCIH